MVEAALTLPLVIFLVLGTMQLFMMMHARVLAQYAAYRATRAGSLNHGNCERMAHAAVLSLMPAIETFLRPGPGTASQKLAEAFARHGPIPGGNGNNRYNYRATEVLTDGGNNISFTGAIVWIARERPTPAEIAARPMQNGQDVNFDMPGSGPPLVLETRLIFWYPMRIPFANWVMSKMFLANFRLQNYLAQNPLMPVRRSADFAGQDWLATTGGASSVLDAAITAEMAARNNAKEFVFPIEATYSMRMMTPLKQINFQRQHCPPTPNNL